ELARLPLAAFAAAAIHPLQSAPQAQGALVHVAPAPSITHTHQVATGLLGGKPSAAPARKTSGKAGHARMKRSSRGRSVALWHGMADAGASASRSRMSIADVDGASRYWGSYASWSESRGQQRGWTVAMGWNRRLASGGGALWVTLDHAGPCSP